VSIYTFSISKKKGINGDGFKEELKQAIEYARLEAWKCKTGDFASLQEEDWKSEIRY